MELICYAAVFVLAAATAALELRFYLHMLQLSSYQLQGYFRFLRTHPRYPLLSLVSLVVLVLALRLGALPVQLCASALCCGAAMWLYWPRAAKKRFVATARVKRLIAILCGLVAVLLLLGAARSGLVEGAIAGAPVLLVPWGWLLVAVAHGISLPVERGVQRWYIRDAQRMLREHPGLRIVGITGSFGKTSVKHYLTAMLSECYSVLMTPGSFNTPMGVVRTIREQLKPTHEIFVCEMGARHVGDIKEICDIVHPRDGILTAIGDQHLETFHTRENIIRTKFELLDAVEAAGDGWKLVNGDDADIMAHCGYPDAITYGLGEGNMYRGEILSVDARGTRFRVTGPALRDAVRAAGAGEEAGARWEEEFAMPLVGRHNVINVVGAVAAAHVLGVPLAKCRTAARKLRPAEHRLELRRAPYGAILDDAYNSNPAGARAALEALDAVARGDGSSEPLLRILVTPGMVELGEKQSDYNAELGAEAAAVCDYVLAVGHTNGEALRRGALGAGLPEARFFGCGSLQEAMGIMATLEPGRQRVVLLENDLPDDYQ